MRKSGFTYLEIIVMLCGLLALGSHFHAIVRQMVLEPNLLDFAYYYIWGTLVDKGINYFSLVDLTSQSLELLSSSTNIPISHLQQRSIGTFLPNGFALYSPSFLAFMSFFSKMDFVTAAMLWTIMNYMALIASIFFLAKALDINITWLNAFIFSSIVFSFQPLLECVAIGQANLLILLLLSTGLWAITHEKHWLAGFLIACALHIKPQYGVVCLLLIIKRQYRPLLFSVVSYFLISVSTLFLVGLQFQLDYFFNLIDMGQYTSRLLIWHFNLSLLASLTRFLGADHILIAKIIYGALAFAVVGYLTRFLWRPYRHDVFSLEYSAVVLISLLFLPVTEEHYFVLLYLSIFVIYSYLGHLDKAWQVLFIIAFLLLAVRYSLGRFDQFQLGFPSLLGNGKLYGLILLTAVNFRCWLAAIRNNSE
jgi:hypothetical protein